MHREFRCWWISSSSLKKMQLSALERDSPRTKRNVISTTTSTDTSLNLKKCGMMESCGGNKLQRGDLKGEWENALFVTTVNVSGLNCGRDHAKVCSEGLQALWNREPLTLRNPEKVSGTLTREVSQTMGVLLLTFSAINLRENPQVMTTA